MRVQRGYRSPRNFRRSSRYQSPNNHYSKANRIQQQNSPIISKMIELHNRIEGLTTELGEKTKRENDILGRVENVLQMSKHQEIKSLKIIESLDKQQQQLGVMATLKTRLDHQEKQLGEMATLKTRLDKQQQQLGEMSILKARVDHQEQQLGEMATLKARVDHQEQQLNTAMIELINCDKKITNIIETSLTFFASKLDQNILDQRTIETKMEKLNNIITHISTPAPKDVEEKAVSPEPTPAPKDVEEQAVSPEPTPASKDVEEQAVSPEPTPAPLVKKQKKRRKKRSIEISLDDE